MVEKLAQNTDSVFPAVGVAMATPFLPDGALDEKSTRKLLKHLLDGGVDCLVISGTTGEAPTTTAEEKAKLLRLAREEAGDKAFIIGGASSNDTAHAVQAALQAQEAGAQGLLITPPYYNRPSQEGVYQHIKAVHDATDLPIMLYDIPGRTGVAIKDEAFYRLAELPRVKAVKDATGNVLQGLERLERTGIAFHSGDDALNYSWLAHGGAGVISVIGHVAPRTLTKLVRAVMSGDLATGRQLALQLQHLTQAIMGGGQGAVMVKAALAHLGIITHPTVRLPLVEAPEEEVQALGTVLDTFAD